MAPNGEDIEGISFGTDGWRARGEEFSVPRIRAVGQATVDYLDDEGRDGPLAIGYDARENSEMAAKELARVLAAGGRDVTVAARDCPTPALAWTVGDGPFVAGLMVTASHNPPEYNGIKFVGADGAPALPDVTEGLAERLRAPEPGSEAVYGTVEREQLHEPYLDHAQSYADGDLDGFAVAVDAMHGSARGATDELLDRMGATVTRLRCDRDPSFGGGSPEPGPENAEQLLSDVADGNADLGFINDGDGDRIGVVTPDHGYLDPNLVLALLYQFVLESEGGDAARTVSTSSLVDKIAEEAGFSTHETPVGFKWIAQAMGDHDIVAGGEESGGYGVAGHLHNKDGVLIAALLAAAHVERALDDRIEEIRSTHGFRVQSRRSVSCPDERKPAVLAGIDGEFDDEIAGAAVESVNDIDGVKFLLSDDSWLLIRPSGTEPKMRVYAESETGERTAALLDAGEAAVEAVLD